ncbi:MAG: acetylglutamate kinase [Chloroflexi bacterium]|nr:acetylglutamate kinase [Chloroflexota bacterium]
MMKGSVTVVKIGGVASKSDTVVEDIVKLHSAGERLVVVHGGGNLVTEWLKRQGVATTFVRGERVTDRATLEVVIAVLAGLANKQIVAAINASGGRAVGLSGVDGGLIEGEIKNREMGYVGAVSRVNPGPVTALLAAGYVPVVAPVSLSANPDECQIVNINGDPVAGEIALALEAGRLVFMTDIAGVCDRSGALLPRLSAAEAAELISSGTASGGMIPKISAALRALSRGAVTRIVDGRAPHALVRVIEGEGGGTTIVT